MQEERSHKKVAYLHGRPHSHPIHMMLAKRVGADFYFIDFKMRWQDTNKPFLYRVISWFVCALQQPNVSSHDIFLVDNLHFSPIIMKYLKLNRKKQKIVVHMGSHTLYFMYSKKFGPINNFLHKWALSKYDAIICEGKMAVDFTNKLLPGKKPRIFYSFNGLSEARINTLSKINPNLAGKNILTIAQIGGAEFRLWYKGIDVMLKAFEQAHKADNALTLTVVGGFDQKILDTYLTGIPDAAKQNITFTGYTTDLPDYYSKASLFLHTARGDAFPTTTLEAMCAGIPTLVSDITGTKEIVEQVNKDLVVEMDGDRIAKKILNYFSLPISEKQALSERSRKVTLPFTEESSVSNYQDIINTIRKEMIRP